MGTGSFVFATRYSQYGLAATGILGPPIFVIYSLLTLVLAVSYRCKHGQWLKKENSRVVDENGKCKFKNMLMPLFHASVNVGYLFVMSAAWDFARRGGLNQGVISTLLSAAGVFNVGTFYCFFKQKVTGWQLIGVVLMMICVLCLSIESNNKKKEELSSTNEEDGEVLDGRQKATLCFLAILLGLLAAVMMSTKHLVTKCSNSGGYAAFD